MLAAYGVDVLDPAVSTRRVHVLLQQLPPAARRGGQHWSTECELLAGAIDHLAALTYVTQKVNGSKSAKKPKPVTRPPFREPWRDAAAPGPRRALGAGSDGPAPVKAQSWIEAALAMSKVPGVEVSSG